MKRLGWKKWVIALFLLLALAVAGMFIWALTPLGPMPEALAALESGPQVTVSQGDWLVFRPVTGQPDTGLVFYPGGRVDYRSYAPAAHALAEQGYLVVIPRMPLSLAVFDMDAAAQIQAAYPEIQHWALGGHSLGGAMAARYLAENPGAADGLLLWASYAVEPDDLSASGLHALSITGSADGVLDQQRYADSRALLPADTTWLEITGGNHGQFGWYGSQSGDNPAEITREEQQRQVIEATRVFLENLATP